MCLRASREIVSAPRAARLDGRGRGGFARRRRVSRELGPPPPRAPQIQSVEDALEELTAAETVMGYRPRAGAEPVQATKTLRLQRLPHILTLHLMRYEFGGASGPGAAKVSRPAGACTGALPHQPPPHPLGCAARVAEGKPLPPHPCTPPTPATPRPLRKVTKRVAFGQRLTIRGQWTTPDSRERGAVFELVATVSHRGAVATSGHYTADVLHSSGRCGAWACQGWHGEEGAWALARPWGRRLPGSPCALKSPPPQKPVCAQVAAV